MWSPSFKSVKNAFFGPPSNSSTPSQRAQEAVRRKKIAEKTEVPIELISNDLIRIQDDDKRMQKADRLLKELEGLKDFYKDANDKMVVDAVIEGIKKYCSENIGTSNAEKIDISSAKILPSLFEDFSNAFRYQDIEEKKDKSTLRAGRPLPK